MADQHDRIDNDAERLASTAVPSDGDDAVPVNDQPITADEAVVDDASDAAANEPEREGTDEGAEAAKAAEERLLQLFQSTVFAESGEKIGRVGQVYLDDQTQDPNWVTVKTGLFGTKEFFVPLDDATFGDKRIVVPYAKDTVITAPRTEIDQNLSPSEEDDLYAHYQVPGRVTAAEAPADTGDDADDTATAPDSADDALATPTDTSEALTFDLDAASDEETAPAEADTAFAPPADETPDTTQVDATEADLDPDVADVDDDR